MSAKARVYRTSAARCEERARGERDPANREWQMILSRAYRMLAEAEVEAAARPLSAAA
jgi:hypothetical protein